MNEGLRVILCVSLAGCFTVPPTGVLVFNLHLLIHKISWFVLNPKQAYLHIPPPPPALWVVAQKQTLRPPAGWRDGPQNPHSSAHPVLGCVGSAKSVRWSGSLRATSVILSHLPAKREGKMHSRGLKEGWAGLWERIPLPAGWSDWMRVTTMAVTFAKSSLKLTMWPVEEQTEKEIEVNNIVTY